jgi:(1->4)-alpha-D-glucan 1-alpha-D-glucosylmutase
MRVPLATYRLQFHKDFGFRAARSLLAYLRDLGVSDLYASPIFQARAGSRHGYDVVDPNRLNAELGSPEDFDALFAELRRLGMGWLQDFVPNHMAYDGQNHLLMDVLENGEGSPYYDYFDIEWSHPYESIRGKILAPFLGDFYGRCLENCEIALRYDQAGLSVNYYALRFPLRVDSYSTVFAQGLGALRRKLGSGHPDFIKLLGVLYALKNLPPAEESAERADMIKFVKSLLWELYGSNAEIKQFIDDNVARFNGERGNAESFNLIDQLLADQVFRLSFWKVATEEINYRRFFNINELISLRMEEEKVFAHTHALLFRLVAEGKVTGIRIDHIDGLYDPARYLRKVRERAGEVYLTVEKILDLDEELPLHWPVQGTTGYDFANYANGIFCERKNEKRLTEIYTRFTGQTTAYSDLVSAKKRLIIGKHMAGDVDGLAHLMKRISSRDRYGSDITLYGLRRALVEVLTFFPVYRSYVDQETYREEDRARIQETIAKAKEMNPGLLLELDFIERFLLLEFPDHLAADEKRQWVHFIMRFQQLTGPLMAKGFEDTTFYVYNRLLSLNEVGGNPGRFGVAIENFHEFNQRRAHRWIHTMNASATHDTKRGEDVRARLNVLSELPEEWEACLKAWSKLNRGKKAMLKGKEVPERNDEYFLYQTLVGAFPFAEDPSGSFAERVKDYLIKAVREAKVHTEWLKPDIAYEEAFLAFIDAILKPAESNEFLTSFVPFVNKVAHYGMVNSLAQTFLKMLSPGVPDFYQGTELWDLSFVDPDNRRPVDFAAHLELLSEIKRREKNDLKSLLADLVGRMEDGRIKLYLIYKTLGYRGAEPELMRTGDYLPLGATGKGREHLCAFARRNNGGWAVAAAPRLTTKLCGPEGLPLGERAWQASALLLPREAPGRWRDHLTGETLTAVEAGGKKQLALAEVFGAFPVALLTAA